MAKAINDATQSKMGDIYQYIIALKDCFALKKDETLLIEVQGDVSTINKNNGLVQKEIKHHISKDNLTDRDVDFWKTLANWYVSYDEIKKFDSLVLYTTSIIPSNGKLEEWNNKTKEEKLAILIEIGAEKKEREKTFRSEYDRIFNDGYNKENLLDILDKFTIENKQANIEKITETIYPSIITIPDEHKWNFVASLLGVILISITNPPFKWIITYDAFQTIVQTEAAKYYRTDCLPLPLEFAQQEPDKKSADALLEKVFVKAIKDIEYDEVIPEAVSDYWKFSMTITKYFQDNPTYCRDIKQYQIDLKTKMNATKRNAILDAEEATRNEKIKIGKKLYNDVIAWDAKDFGSIIQNQAYFQHGVIHDIVDEKEFKWFVGEEEE